MHGAHIVNNKVNAHPANYTVCEAAPKHHTHELTKNNMAKVPEIEICKPGT
jgi:hypothetical protein